MTAEKILEHIMNRLPANYTYEYDDEDAGVAYIDNASDEVDFMVTVRPVRKGQNEIIRDKS